jgi:hypothetical protein
MRQPKPQARQEHTPVWQTLWSVRSRLCELLFPGEYEQGRKVRSVQSAPPSACDAKESPPYTEKDSAAYWAVRIGKDVVIVTFQLLHLLLAGYDPKRKKPDIAWLSPERIKTQRSQ